MKEVAETNLSRAVDDCVISCPVFYGEEQRRALQGRVWNIKLFQRYF